MEFHQWLEGLTEELRENPAVQKRAYLHRDTAVNDVPAGCGKPFMPASASDDFKEHADWSITERAWLAPCKVCERACEVLCDPEDFEADSHYCGGSPMCCP